MAKYCVKCGKALPEGVEICPDCNALGQSEADAALFTMLTSSAEIWRESEDEEKKKRERAKRRRKYRKQLAMVIAGAVLIALVVFLVVFNLPAARVGRALDNGDYDKALSIWVEKLSDSQPSERTEAKLLSAAERVLASYAAREISDDQVNDSMMTLFEFGSFTDSLFADVIMELEKLHSSSASMKAADELFARGDYLAACDSYLLVVESDALYAEAQEKANASLEAYAQEALKEAKTLFEAQEYTAAIELLKACDGELLDYGTFSADIDAKLEDYYKLYESHILSSAKALADEEDYAGARELVRACVEDFAYSTEALVAALEEYSALFDKQLLALTVSEADELYAAGSYAEAFESLEAIVDQLSGEDKDAAKEAVAELEKRYGEDMCAKADADYNGDRHALADVIAALEAALEIRDLDVIDDKIDHLEQFLPFDLIIDAYSEKEGEVNRNSTDFKALDGSKYEKWMWGRDEASIEFELDAEYDVFEAVFAVRGDKEDGKGAYFELWFDGEKAYTSDELKSDSESPVEKVEVDLTGVKVMKIVFCCDYEASPTENGYSYHGICMAEAYRKDK